MMALIVLALCAALGAASPAHGRTLLLEADVETPAWHHGTKPTISLFASRLTQRRPQR